MKLSTRIKRYVAPDLISGRKIVLMVDCKEIIIANTLTEADTVHKELTEKMGCKLLPLNECPVVNGRNEIIMHYTTTTYKDWCNGGA